MGTLIKFMDYNVSELTTKALQAAIDFAESSGGGRVVVEPGVHECHGIILKSNVELHLMAGARLVGSENPDDIPDFNPPGLESIRPDFTQKCLIACANAENVSITGEGMVDGLGTTYYNHNARLYPDFDFWERTDKQRPRLIEFYNCRNVNLQGFTLKDSPGWTMWLTHCQDVHINAIKIDGNQHMITDGIDLNCCQRVTIRDCFIRTGDDCISIRAMRRHKEEIAVTEQILVSNCTLDSGCQCVRIGCPSDDTIRHVIFHGVTMLGQNNGIFCEGSLYYLRPDDTGYLHAHNIMFNDIIIECPRQAIGIVIDSGLTLRGIHDFSFNNIQIKSGNAIRLEGNVKTPLENISFNHVSGTVSAMPEPIVTKYVKNLRFTDFDITATNGPAESLQRIQSASWEACK